MEKLIAGTKVTADAKAAAGVVAAAETCSGSTGFCDFSIIVKKCHEECGDSAFAYSDAKKAVIGIFDGVSGEPGAALASSAAASAALLHLKALDRCDGKQMKEALMQAQLAVSAGYTTAIVLFLHADGSFIIAGVGDSPAYGISSGGKISLEIPPSRTTGDRDSIFKFFYFRNLVTAVLGPGGKDVAINMRSGKLKKGEVIIIASDGLLDNLWVKVHDGYVADSSGTADLAGLIGKERSPKKIIALLVKEIVTRIKAGKKEKAGLMLVPKEDDIAIAALRFK
jgi:serine/threonine protein phosphatase PrpC